MSFQSTTIDQCYEQSQINDKWDILFGRKNKAFVTKNIMFSYKKNFFLFQCETPNVPM